jgi:hypothetical protein
VPVPPDSREATGVRQAELFAGSACLPASIHVGPFGVAEDWLGSVLSVTVDQLHAWHGDQLGSPRDYTYRAHGYFATAAGIRRILELTGRPGAVDVIERTVPAPPPRPQILPGAQRAGGFAHHAAAGIEAGEDRR